MLFRVFSLKMKSEFKVKVRGFRESLTQIETLIDNDSQNPLTLNAVSTVECSIERFI